MKRQQSNKPYPSLSQQSYYLIYKTLALMSLLKIVKHMLTGW